MLAVNGDGFIVADTHDPKSNVPAHDDGSLCSERGPNADQPCSGDTRTSAVGLRPSAGVAAYMPEAEEPPTFAVAVAVVRFAAVRTRPSR
jgi:hypothetical protein